MTRRLFSAPAELYLLVGPDETRLVKFGPISFETMAVLIVDSKVGAGLVVNRDVMDDEEKDLLFRAVRQFNETFDDSFSSYSVDGVWRWYGLAVESTMDQAHLWAQVGTTGQQVEIRIDQDQLDSEARTCCLAAIEALKPVLGDLKNDH